MTNNKQQTAVEWFIEQLRNNENIRWRGTNIIELGEQAKEMERERIIKAYNEDLYGGLSGHRKFNDGEDYYKQTYGGGEQ